MTKNLVKEDMKVIEKAKTKDKQVDAAQKEKHCKVIRLKVPLS